MQLAIVNPIKRKGKKRRSTKRKVRRNPISNLGAFAKKKRSGSKKRRSTKRRALSVSVPRKTKRHSRKRRSGGGITRTVSRVANSGVSGLLSSAAPAAIGAGGAMLVDLGWGYIPLADSIKNGPLSPLIRIAAAAAIGMFAGWLGGKKFGREAMVGAMTVTTFDVVKGYLKNNTSLPLSFYAARSLPPQYGPPGLGYYAPDSGYADVGAIDPEGYAIDAFGSAALALG